MCQHSRAIKRAPLHARASAHHRAFVPPPNTPITPPFFATLPLLKRTVAMVSSKGKPTDPKLREEIKESEWAGLTGTVVLYRQSAVLATKVPRRVTSDLPAETR